MQSLVLHLEKSDVSKNADEDSITFVVAEPRVVACISTKFANR